MPRDSDYNVAADSHMQHVDQVVPLWTSRNAADVRKEGAEKILEMLSSTASTLGTFVTVMQ